MFAQEAGKSGELLKNELNSAEYAKRVGRTLETTRNGSNNLNSNRTKQTGRRNSNDYRWNYNYGNAEVFLRIPEQGRFTVEIGDQVISNSSGKFRFFDLRAGVVSIAVYDTNFLIYKTRIALQNNTRTVIDFFSDYGLYHLGNYPQNNQSYGFNQWDDIWNNPYANQQGNWNGFTGDQSQFLNVMNNQDFTNLTKALKRNSYNDDNKSQVIISATQYSRLTAVQILDLVQLLDFESNKLKLAKQLFANCVDKQNFFQVYQGFNFQSSIRELIAFVQMFTF